MSGKRSRARRTNNLTLSVRALLLLLFQLAYAPGPKVAKAEDGENIKPISDPPLWEFAGLFDTWYDPENLGEKIYTFTLITTEPSEQFASIHNRMPVIIRPTDRWKWLDPHTSVDEALKLLQPYPELIDMYDLIHLI